MVGLFGASLGPVRGRFPELGVVQEHLGAGANGRSAVLLIDGPLGIGKSRLVLHALAVADGRAMAAVHADQDHHDDLLPLAPLPEALLSAVRTPPPGSGDGGAWLFDRLRTDLETRSAQAPLLVALDGLQRCKPVTLRTVERLVQDLATYPLVWVLAGRAADRADRTGQGAALDGTFDRLEQCHRAARLRLDPLAPQATTQLIGDLVGAEPDDELVEAVAAAAGNPLLVIELVHGLQEEGSIEVVEDRARMVSPGRPLPLERIVTWRLSGLPAETVRLLDVGAVLGRSFSLIDVAEVEGQLAGSLEAAVDPAIRAGVVISQRGRLAFGHDLVHRAVYEGLSDLARLALHRAIGSLLLGRGGQTAAAAAHMIEGARRGDEQVLAELDAAIAELLSSAPEVAASLALRALALTDAADDSRFVRTLSAVDALLAARRFGAADDLARRALELAGSPQQTTAELRLRLSSLAFTSGRNAEAVAQAEIVLAEMDLPVRLYTGAETARLLALIAEGDLEQARRPAEAILAGGDRPGVDASLPAALTALGFIAWYEGRLADAIGMLRAAVRRADRSPPEARHNHSRFGLAFMLRAVGDFAEADALIMQGSRQLDELGETGMIAAPAISRSRLLLAAGRADEAQAEAEAGLESADAFGTGYFVPLAVAALASVALFRGDLGATAEHIERYRAEAGSNLRFGLYAETYAWVEGRVAEARGGSAAAVEVMSDVYRDLPARKRLLVEEPAAAAWLVRIALDTGDRRRAEAVVAWAEQLAADNEEFSSVVASADHARGLLAGDPDALERAIAQYRHPWARATAMEDHGVLMAGSDPAAARGHLEDALTGYDGLGAERDAERVRSRLGQLGVQVRSRSGDPPPAAGWESLTDTEGRVAELAAEALTNRKIAERLFLSRHTVDFHLRKIFRKLGVISRVELTRSFLQRRRQPDATS